MAYTHDADSRVTGMTWTLAGNQVGDLEYAYDADGHVIQKTGSLAQTDLPQAVTGNAFNADNEMTAFNGVPLTYDPNGNLVNDGTNTYAWDERNHLVGITVMNTGANTASFVYDGLGRRAMKAINETSTQFLYDGLNPVEELDASSPPNVTANMLTGLGIDEYFQRSDASGTSSYITDALGSTLALANSAGGLATSYTYDPFGNTTAAGSSSNAYQFTGRENDGTGLYYYRARYHSPAYQRFIAQDPIEFRGGDFNLYGYALNSPLNGTDPSGQGIMDCISLMRKTSQLIAAKNGCLAELQRCDNPSDDLIKDLDSAVCRQDFCSKYGVPASAALAVASCACQKVGLRTACVAFMLNGFQCSY